MSAHWKDWMDYTHSERNGFILLILVIIVGLCLPYLYPYILPEEKTDFSKIHKALALIEEQRIIDSIKLAEIQNEKFKRDSLRTHPFYFDPNNATFNDFINLGLSKKVAHTIVNFREKNGRFYEKDDFRKIYGITDTDYLRLENFISINKLISERRVEWNKPEFNIDETKSLSINNLSTIEINSSDSIELMKLNGIGPAFSSMIIKYRNLLGGYRDKSQLLEVYGMDSTRWSKIIEYIEIDTSLIIPISLNEAEWIDLVKHPYINKEIANNIINYRKHNGYYTSVSDIKNYYLVNKRLYRKIASYLVVDDRAEAKKPD